MHGAARSPGQAIRIRGARQNNLKNLDLDLPTNQLVVVTGVSGSGKSSLVFDTLYAEGQRRYVETFSAYARQFLDRMDKPQVDRIEGVPPAIAIDQSNPVRTSRSTVGTMTELNDHLKLLFARAAELHCRHCGQPVRRDTAESIVDEIVKRSSAAAQDGAEPRVLVSFAIKVPKEFDADQIRGFLEGQGYTRILGERKVGEEAWLDVVQDRFRVSSTGRARIAEAVEAALVMSKRSGPGALAVRYQDAVGADGVASETIERFSVDLHCPACDIHYQDPVPSTFSFNSPVGACETCRGFGRVIGVDFGLVIPDERKTLAEGAIKAWQSASFAEQQTELMQSAKKLGIPTDVPWSQLSDEQRDWVLEGDAGFVSWKKSWPGKWYGVRRFFAWLESKAYKMHIRVLLSKYRSYTPCPACHGARLKPDALLWRVRGRNVHDLMNQPIVELRAFFDSIDAERDIATPFGAALAAGDEAALLLMSELRARTRFLQEVGLGYLTLDRQGRTLSGGEVQRINLTTALGTSLVNTLFVLDEPSIGLHPRDMDRIIAVMHRLRDAGNSLVVVEHDPQVMLAADRILEIGPGPGERGGDIVFQGTVAQARTASTATGDYLSGRKRVELPDRERPAAPDIDADARWLSIGGVRAHNLDDVELRVPLNRLVVVTGVSGSGKSTLVEDMLYGALRKTQGKPAELPGTFDALIGADQFDDVVMVDQSAIGKTARSNPASYVGAFDAIREVFARTPESKRRGYAAGTFSFNSGDGRCPTCTGTGFEHVEMQFLSDVYLRCPDCNGSRYRDETLDVKISGTDADGVFREASIAEVLDMTVNEAVAYFSEEPAVLTGLRPLAEVGLDYLKLGQPVPTLSGGEAQRLKLAGHLAEAAQKSAASKKARAKAANTDALKGKLFLFDEPTTGLHFEDIATLLRAFGQLLAAGNSLVVIEHNLDVIRAADWIVDLGPEGGSGGGKIMATGTPAQIVAHPESHTGRSLALYERSFEQGALVATHAAEAVIPYARSCNAITIHHAREHNLKDIDVEIPLNRFTVITGPSGSGKSTLAFDILFAEGQRRYLESLNAYARSIVQPQGRPDVDAIHGIPPTVAIEQRTSRGGRKSTVATLTEIHHFLRLLYVKLGVQHCTRCHVPVRAQSFDSIVARIQREHRGRRVGLLAPLVVNRKGVYTDLAKWAAGKGYSHLRVDGEFLPTAKFPRLDRFKEHSIELPVADVVADPAEEARLREAVKLTLEFGRGFLLVLEGLDSLEQTIAGGDRTGAAATMAGTFMSTKRACPSCGTSYAELDPRLFSYNSKHGWCGGCFGTGLALGGFDAENVDRSDGREGSWRDAAETAADQIAEQAAAAGDAAMVCPQCDGQRLNPIALAVQFRGHSVAALSRLSVEQIGAFFGELTLEGRELEIARDLLVEIKARIEFLTEVGLDYLALDRAAPTLSGGEAQRIRLAAQLGSNLQGVCYILDEPTIGLHPRDNRLLLEVLGKLQAKGNTLVVVEHDEDTILRADHVIDIGPGAGVRGGTIVAQGPALSLDAETSITGRMLHRPLQHPLQPRRHVDDASPAIFVRSADLHNLKGIDARFPIGRLTAVTGVSGSGKSSLARDLLHDNARKRVLDRKAAVAGCLDVEGLEVIDRVLEVDQTPIGKTPRSCPATYIGIWDDIRKLFADSQDARLRGYTATRFSFNTGDGRCPVCEGQGQRTLEMNFLPDVKMLCDACHGARFNRETREVQMRGRSISDVLAMDVDDAVEYFAAHNRLRHSLKLLQDVGLGYLTLGQSSATLSGGEAQRIKLVTELAKVRDDVTRRGQRAPHTLYVLDEPTVGLHMSDVERLIAVLHRLVDAGNTVVVVEHDFDLVAEADWIVDLGPEGGTRGGEIVAMGTLEDVLATRRKVSHTARLLGEFLERRKALAPAA